ncbi:MAG: hypothetical protein QOG85_1097 [Gaiellaceae bacterium]|jgi:hypothetical protein|nr:hypothetical protein [Gaiellaceae bacterium]
MNRRRGIAAALVTTAGFAVGLAFALHSSPDLPSATVGRLILPIPRGFNSYPRPVNRGPGSPLASRVITNYPVPADTTIDRVLSHWAAADMKYVYVKNYNHGAPSFVVALELSLDSPDGPGCIGPCPPPSVRLHLPLDPSQPWVQEQVANGDPSFRHGYFRFHGQLYSVVYWIGGDAQPSDRAALLSALRSIRPAR